MISERQKLIDQIYTRALELGSDERDAYLAACCKDDEVRQEVLSLLQAATSNRLDERIHAARESVLRELVADTSPQEEDLTGQLVGRWRIAGRLARGGLATVYMAHRADGEFEQKAAFKVLRRGLDTDDLVARFRSERQILSALDHPAIAQILDGGALRDGRPYLVLEFVDGEPITSHCDRVNPDIRGRITLMLAVLSGLHHAHRHTIVHRDIKPSNILVSTEGNVVLLDFGIAKLLDPEAMPGASTLTRTGVSLLTPGYGSPEQRAGQLVTTASDIYQAGGVLYELLAGVRADTSGAMQTRRILPPSKHLDGTPRYRQVRGDLDAIVLKAMHAEPARRYASANEMATDLERYLRGQPVAAQPDTLLYRLRKLTRRRPWLMPAATVSILAIAGYIVTLTLYSAQLRLEQQRAEAAQTFMVDLFRSTDPFAPADPDRGRNITVVEALEIGRERLNEGLVDQPRLRATLLDSVAGVYQSLDQNQAAIELGEEALALNRDLYGERSEAVMETLRLLADQYNASGDYDKARTYSARQLEIARAAFDSDDVRLGLAEVAAGTIELSQGAIDRGLALLESGIRILRVDPGANPDVFISAIIASTEQHGMNDARSALELLDHGLQIAESAYGPGSLHAARLRIAIGRNAFYMHDQQRAVENYQRGLRILEARLGRDHGSTIVALQDYAASMNVLGDHVGSERVYRDLLGRLVEQRGEMHRSVADAYQNLATTITYQDRVDESLPLHRKAYDIYSTVLDDDSYIIAFPLLSIASVEVERGNAVEAEAAATEALARLRAAVPGTYVEGVALCLVGLSLELQGNETDGSAMVAASHALILQRGVMVPKYLELCRVPATDVSAAPE